jgi:hypothetical protein
VEPGLPQSAGFGPVMSSLFLARTVAASTIALVQCISPAALNRSSTAQCNLRHNPALVHSMNRRCAVAFHTPRPLRRL